MFDRLIQAVESYFPDQSTRLTPEQHKDAVDHVVPLLYSNAAPLLGAAQAILGGGIFETSEIGFEYSAVKPDQDGLLKLPVSFAKMYVCPGKAQRDISLNVSVARRYTTQRQVLDSAVDLELEVRELPSKLIFESLYKDYRAQISRLLTQGQIKFFTSYCSDIVGKSRSNKISARLDEYFSDPKADYWFVLGMRCSGGTSHADAIRGFLALSLLYIACHAGLAGKGGRISFERSLARLI